MLIFVGSQLVINLSEKYKDIIYKIENTNLLENNQENFEKTSMLKRIYDALKMRHGLIDGKKHTYDEISKNFLPLTRPKQFIIPYEHISKETVRVYLAKGYRILSKSFPDSAASEPQA